MKKLMNLKFLLTFISFMLLINPLLSFAERFQATIHSVEEGQGEEDNLIKLLDGRVVFTQDDNLMNSSDLLPGSRVEIEIDEQLNLLSIATLGPLPLEDYPDETPALTLSEPTILPNYPAARSIFNGMNRSYKQDSECSDRAHVWAYEEWKKHNLYSRKVFLFFTNTYIRAYRYKWWFHVSPYTLVKEHGTVIEHVLDRRYTSYPYHMKEWTDVFMISKQTCPVKTYAYYRANTNGPKHCVLVKVDMYYRLPLHVRDLEERGIVKTQFSQNEVNFSYRAFTRRGVGR